MYSTIADWADQTKPLTTRTLRAILMLAVLLGSAACGKGGQSETDAFNESHARAEALLAPDLPRGWHYNFQRDEIGGKDVTLASIANEDADMSRDQTLILSIQQEGNDAPAIFFRGREQTLSCNNVCGVRYRADGKTGSWLAERIYDGSGVVITDAGALNVLGSAKSIIIEIGGDVAGQRHFNVIGLKWPPKKQ